MAKPIKMSWTVVSPKKSMLSVKASSNAISSVLAADEAMVVEVELVNDVDVVVDVDVDVNGGAARSMFWGFKCVNV